MKLSRIAALVVLLSAFGCGEGSTTQELCYNYSCGGGDTGQKCFETRQAYCASVCQEADSCAMNDCMQNCQ